MASLEQVRQQIRFALDQLSVRNGQFEFEHLCFNLARQRICRNILPATGPVSAGGDQGRDFETFRTYLQSRFPSDSAFIGYRTEETIAFACSLQKNAIEDKIRSDVDKILASGTSVAAVYFFSPEDIPVGKRHALQEWAQEKFSIYLEILDGQAITVQLSDKENFWIAEEFLNISSNIYPTPTTEDEDQWYAEYLDKWKQDKYLLTTAAFSEVKMCLRHSVHAEKFIQDVSFWLSKMNLFIQETDLPLFLKRRALYEIILASVKRGIPIQDYSDNIHEYFDKINDLQFTDDLEDTAVLLCIISSAAIFGLIEVGNQYLTSWDQSIRGKTEVEIELAENPGRKCRLYEIRGYISSNPGPLKGEPPDLSETLNWWNRLLEEVINAPLYPLEKFHERLLAYIRLFNEYQITPEEISKFEEFSQRIDPLLAARYGDFKAAEMCRDRAILFYNNGQLIKAIRLLHTSKIKWFTAETLQGSILAMMLLADWYCELGLSFAAKYYALAAAYSSLNASEDELRKYFPRALIKAGKCDFSQGAWCGYLEFTSLGLAAHTENVSDPFNVEIHQYILKVFAQTSTLIYLTERICPEYSTFVSDVTKNWLADDWISDLVNEIRNEWGKHEDDKIWDMIHSQLCGIPFSDFGNKRKIAWSALGVEWLAEWDNNYKTTVFGEQFLATLQILLCDLAGVDLCLLSTEVHLTVEVDAEINTPAIDDVSTNEIAAWRIRLPDYKHESKQQQQDFQVAITAGIILILTRLSLMPSDELNRIFHDRFKEGLADKTLIVNPYYLLFQEFVDEDYFDSSDRAKKEAPDPNNKWKLRTNEELKWFDEPPQGYTKQKAQDKIKYRYTNIPKMLKRTLPILKESGEFLKTVKELRTDGWKDWHILLAVLNATCNFRVHADPVIRNNPALMKKLFKRTVDEGESSEDIEVSAEYFTKEHLLKNLEFSVLGTLNAFNLYPNQKITNFSAIFHFLGIRCGYWDDDVEHNDPFN